MFNKPTNQLSYLWVTGNANTTCEMLGARGGFPNATAELLPYTCVDDTVCTVELPYLLADGICNGKKDGYETAECQYDGGDCKSDSEVLGRSDSGWLSVAAVAVAVAAAAAARARSSRLAGATSTRSSPAASGSMLIR